MRKQSTDRLIWKNNKLYCNNTFTKYFVYEHDEYKGMFYFSTQLGNSEDFYNLTRAKYHTLRLYMKDMNYDMEE